MGDSGRNERIITPSDTYGHKVRSLSEAPPHTTTNSTVDRAA
jgi:hypothetical protein